MVFLTGDCHGDFRRIEAFCDKFNTTKNDTLVILGDAGINYWGNKTDVRNKRYLESLPITFLCVHGNHENRACNIQTYDLVPFCEGMAYQEKEYPSILFALDGGMYELNGKACVVCGGAYSVDKEYRLSRGVNWWKDEQPSQLRKEAFENVLYANHWKVDVVLTHTCPAKYVPIEAFLPGLDQSKVDRSTEMWLDSIESRLNYGFWACAHFHVSKRIDKVQFLFEDYLAI